MHTRWQMMDDVIPRKHEWHRTFELNKNTIKQAKLHSLFLCSINVSHELISNIHHFRYDKMHGEFIFVIELLLRLTTLGRSGLLTSKNTSTLRPWHLCANFSWRQFDPNLLLRWRSTSFLEFLGYYSCMSVHLSVISPAFIRKTCPAQHILLVFCKTPQM